VRNLAGECAVPALADTTQRASSNLRLRRVEELKGFAAHELRPIAFVLHIASCRRHVGVANEACDIGQIKRPGGVEIGHN